ncbi:hypothetical protein ACFIQF_19230 [Comamonas sp. J-3]|uniref:hypothetical protein n=1 Tax=Comamonas trifloxystrobinivorans TaxID=3350256 RepID=UPI0037262CB2
MKTKNNAARVAVTAAACADIATKAKPRDVFDCIAMDLPRDQWESAMGKSEANSEADNEQQPVDIHDICRHSMACGFTRDLSLTEWEARAINTRLYGLNAISALLIAADDGEALKLSGWLQGGLHNALFALAEDAQDVLHRANEKAEKAEKGGAA